MNLHLSQYLCKYKKLGLPNDVTKNSLPSIHKYIQILEEEMVVHELLQRKECPLYIIDDDELNPLHKRSVQ